MGGGDNISRQNESSVLVSMCIRQILYIHDGTECSEKAITS